MVNLKFLRASVFVAVGTSVLCFGQLATAAGDRHVSYIDPSDNVTRAIMGNSTYVGIDILNFPEYGPFGGVWIYYFVSTTPLSTTYNPSRSGIMINRPNKPFTNHFESFAPPGGDCWTEETRFTVRDGSLYAIITTKNDSAPDNETDYEKGFTLTIFKLDPIPNDTGVTEVTYFDAVFSKEFPEAHYCSFDDVTSLVDNAVTQVAK